MSPPSASAPFRKVGETTEFDGAVIRLVTATFEAPDGSEFTREVVHHPGAVVVVPVTETGKVIMVRQYRAAPGRELLELPAGKRDVDGEPPEATAARELAEEVGREAGRIDFLANFYNSPGFSDEYSWLYLARDLSEVPLDRQGVEEQEMSVEEVSLHDVLSLIASGDLVDAKSIIGLALTRLRLEREAG